MDPIQEAIAEIESRAPGEHFSYQQIAKKHGVGRMTLARRHKGLTEPYGIRNLALHPQHEAELVRYIKTLTERRIPPTIAMIKRFACSLAGKEVSETWVTRFINRNNNHLISRYTQGMDRLRHKADSGDKYHLYFKLLHQKINEYQVQPTHIFNMDEKGFQLGTIGRTKRVFDKALYSQKGVTQPLQDGSTEWITVLACICSDGSVLSPSLIYKAANGAVQSSWTDAVDPGKHSVFFASSPSGWSNNDIGLAWLKEVFERETRRYASTGYRLLLLDGHSSHVTMDFIKFCDDHNILLAVFPPHATHTLQPLDVGMFKPLSNAYTTQLMAYLQGSQGLLNIAKRDFFSLFWRAWSDTFKPQAIKKSFEATGIQPPNPDVILRKFRKEASDSDESSTSVLSAEDWLKLESIIRRSVKDQRDKDVRKLQRSLHHIAAQNSILHGEIKGLRESLAIKKRRENKGHTLQLNNPEDYHGGSVFWSPRRVQRARDDEVSRQQQAVQLQLQKAEKAQEMEQSRLHKLRVRQEKRVEREKLREVRRREREDQMAEKLRQKRLRDAKKAIQLSQKGKIKPSKAHRPPTKRQKRVGVAPSHVEVASAAPPTPSRSRRSRPIQLPKKYFE